MQAKEIGIDFYNLSFEFTKTNMMFVSDYKNGKWDKGELTSDNSINLHIASTCLHYGQNCFEGLKVYETKSGDITAFRPIENYKRLMNSFFEQKKLIPKGNIVEVKRIGDQLTRKLRDFSATLKTNRLETYIENTEKRLALLKQTTSSLSINYPTSTIEAAFTALNDAESSLINAKSFLENDQIPDTLIELSNSKESEEQAISYLRSDNTSEVPSFSDDPLNLEFP